MRITTLEAYNITNDILEIWRESVGDELLPVQERAIKEFGLFGDNNLIVFSPTSSGKTFIGEMAMVKAAKSDLKVFYLVPQKALAEEKFEELQRRYAKAGLRVVVSSRDRREFDDAIAAGNFNIAVVVFEKLAALLIGCPQLLEKVGLVVVDELQLITDENRGPALELLLTKLKMAKSKPRIVGLSAVLGKAHLLAHWLEAKLLVDTQRPVELRKGVLCKGTFKYREHNSGTLGSEEFADMGGTERQELLLEAAEDLAGRGEQVLVFVSARATTVLCARILADRARLPMLKSAIEELDEQEETHAREALRESLSSSIAFHNSDLSREERALVERHFRSGEIRVLFSTSTLAMGMNLPVKNVVIEGKKWHYFKRYDRWGLDDMSRSEYENMSGRAGRLGLAKEYGRSILVTDSRFQADVWLEKYAAGDFEEIVPTLAEAPLEDLVIDLLASGMAGSDDELRDMLLSSFTGTTSWALKMSKDELKEKLDKAIAICVEGGMATREKGRLKITDLGFVCASKGVGVETTISLAEWARESRRSALSPLEVLTVAAQSTAGADVYVSMSKQERWKADYRRQILGRAEQDRVIERPVFAGHILEQDAASHDSSMAFKKALMLCDWIEEVGIKEIEQRYLVWAGAVRRVGEDFSWLIEAMGAISVTCGWDESRKSEFTELSERLQYGVKRDAVELGRLRVLGLGRTLLRRLVRAGYTRVQELLEDGPARVREVLNHRGAFEKLWMKISKMKEATPSTYPKKAQPEVLLAAEPVERAMAASGNEAELLIDLKANRVCYRGHQVATRPPHHLQRTPLLALAVLASHAGELVSLTELAEGVAKLGHLKKIPVTPDARDLRYKMLRPIKRALPQDLADGIDDLIESIHGAGMKLNCLAELRC